MYIDEYDDIFTNPSEAELVIEEAVSKLKSLLTTEVKKLLDRAKDAKSKLNQINKKIAQRESEYRGLENKLEYLEEKAKNYEDIYIPRLYIKNFVDRATKGFSPGDFVHIVASEIKATPCPICNGTQKIQLTIGQENKELTCPECANGKKYLDEYVVEEDVIQTINLKLCFDSDKVSYWSTDNIFLRNKNRYIAPDMVFKTRVEAEERAEELNEKKRKLNQV